MGCVAQRLDHLAHPDNRNFSAVVPLMRLEDVKGDCFQRYATVVKSTCSSSTIVGVSYHYLMSAN